MDNDSNEEDDKKMMSKPKHFKIASPVEIET